MLPMQATFSIFSSEIAFFGAWDLIACVDSHYATASQSLQRVSSRRPGVKRTIFAAGRRSGCEPPPVGPHF